MTRTTRANSKVYLIAIDEAGYGPKLGPLVVAGSVWQGPDSVIGQGVSVDAMKHNLFEPFTKPVDVAGVSIRVDDSKQIFQSRSTGKNGGSLGALHRIISVAHHLCDRRETSLTERLRTLIPRDHAAIGEVPWLASLMDSQRSVETASRAMVSTKECQPAIEQWSESEWQLLDVRARMIDAGSFNRFFADSDGKKNKSDLLGETSIGLAYDLLNSVSQLVPEGKANEPVQVFFDRHGGRKFYAAPIQQVFVKDGAETPLVRVVSESPKQSVYDLEWRGRPIRLHFTVKGDRFTPVALSSLYAKYLREIAMASLNEYFGQRYAEANGVSSGSEPFRPTAGYPTDAGRFLRMIEPLRVSQRIPLEALVRSR